MFINSYYNSLTILTIVAKANAYSRMLACGSLVVGWVLGYALIHHRQATSLHIRAKLLPNTSPHLGVLL